ncbi:hypothetical protein [Leeuwenhoekiella sp. LLG6367-2.1]|uniref:hypothetical protein n=1 Tax=Leeuwenhoekiella sp. LLG6367-2.1 TaxID=3160833 RepID=UPI00386FE204
MTYQFDVELAKEYGVENAVMLQNIHFWCRKNAANKRNYFEGYFWTYNSQEAFAKLFDFWSRKQVMRVLKNCQKLGALKVSNFNEKSNNRTHWYAVTESVEYFLGPVSTHCPEWD